MYPQVVRQRRQASTTRPSSPSLPRLPVPDLRKTLQGYLKSLEPILHERAARGGQSFDAAYRAQQEVIEDFDRGLGKACQERLLELDARSPHNWLDDNIWLKKAYHEWRAPIIIHSNWWLALEDDLNVPKNIRYPSAERFKFTAWQVRRAAWLVHRVLEFKAQLERKNPNLEDNRSGIWFRHSALQVFNKCRVPREHCDVFSSAASLSEPHARQLLVMSLDMFYAVEVLDSTGQVVPPGIIEQRILAVVRDAKTRQGSGERPVPVGVLTTDDRDRWAKNLRHLLSLSPNNHKVLQTITSSLFALSLDDYSHHLSPSARTPNIDLTAHLHNIRSGHNARPGFNRWYDKPFTLIVEANTRAGVLGEHSPVDALVPSIIADYAVVQGVIEDDFPAKLDPNDLSPRAPSEAVEGWSRLDWVTDDLIARECDAAAERAKQIVDDSDADELVFDAYGTDWIRREARLSPDGYIQMAMQLAWYRTRGSFTATYETVLTRLFDRGRTETVRTLSTDSRAWVLAMTDPESDTETRLALLQRAIQTHTAATRQAATGRGFDRHLLGLRLMLKPEAGESHPLFEDPLFTESQTWKLSSSGLSAGEQFRGTGFGSPYLDGYGINYMPAPERLRFGIESKHSNPSTSTSMFMTVLTDALLDMRTLCTPTLHSHL
ncbi:acyltransferase ChoActase/COT/CPT [Epithele typhae]|uniref:acyltransferase ChoActase/COT/CPT n=1 Tax=Epithele typhae TaxID=378194 RepID=UPI0020087649|nr:acyltransferase ChoActase/COT/CPT [Epithele typhae]KAH9945185.1 acyltransferase ChoActase/COT/CPT [Epithele typhae]